MYETEKSTYFLYLFSFNNNALVKWVLSFYGYFMVADIAKKVSLSLRHNHVNKKLITLTFGTIFHTDSNKFL